MVLIHGGQWPATSSADGWSSIFDHLAEHYEVYAFDKLGMGFTDNPKTMRPLISGVMDLAGVRTPINEIMIAVVCWAVIGLLWLFVNRTRSGKALLAASMNPRALTSPTPWRGFRG